MNTKLLVTLASLSVAFGAFAEANGDCTITLGTTRVDSALKNTIVAVPYVDMGGAGAVKLADLVVTSGLSEGDRCYAMTAKNRYDAWEIVVDGDGVKSWVPMKQYVVTAGGALEEQQAESSETFAPTAGAALWIVRDTNHANPFFLAGKQPEGEVKSPVVANAWNLVANFRPSARTLVELAADLGVAPVQGDQIVLPADDAQPKRIAYKNGVWKGATAETVKPGMGAWYVSKGGTNLDL